MRQSIARMGALLLAVGAAGCSDYLTGPGLTISPNSPTSATKEQFFAAVVVSQFSQQEGQLARIAGMFVQHFAGIARQQQTQGTYTVIEGDVDTYFTRVYAGGGLVDIRQAEALALAVEDSTFAGMAKVWEALIMGTAASLWGDIPYSEAVSDVIKPAVDDQEDIYATIQAKLDTAILWIPKTAGNNKGPGGADLLLGGDRTKYLQTAHTLKARYYMHWVEAQLVGGASLAAAQVACAGDCIMKARDASVNGISANANNSRTFHSAATTEWNFWFAFMVVERAGDLGAGKALVDTLRNRRVGGDQRAVAYFDSVCVTPVGGGCAAFDFRGANQNGAAVPTGSPISLVSDARLAPGNADGAYRQPIITAWENSLIRAEAEFRLGNAGPALTALNAAKAFQAAEYGVAVPAAGALAGAALLTEIKAEKWIAMFQTIEAWNDYKRNCYPVLTPAGTATEVPGRLVYGESERQANDNLLPVAQQPARNENDPLACNNPAHPA